MTNRLWLLILLLLIVSSGYGQEWKEMQKIVADERQGFQFFGHSVSISGKHAIVGFNHGNGIGGIYFYELNGIGSWDQVQRIIGPEMEFGNSVSISGTYAIVGAGFDHFNENGEDSIWGAGSAYFFERDSNGIWNHVQKVVSPVRMKGATFGWSVSISEKFAIVSTHTDFNPFQNNLKTGSAYIYERSETGTWDLVQNIISSDRERGDLFGSSVSISGNYAIVGASNDNFMTFSGNAILHTGSAYIFKRDDSGYWQQVQKLVASEPIRSGYFGWSVSICDNFIIVGAYGNYGIDSIAGADIAYIFERNDNGNWTQVQKLNVLDEYYHSLSGSVSITENFAIVGVPSQHDYAFDGYNPNYYPNDVGAAYILKRNTNGTWKQFQKVVASDRNTYDRFGCSVSIFGNYAIIGACGDDDTTGGSYYNWAGAAYIFSNCPYYVSTTGPEAICTDSTAIFQVEIIPDTASFIWSTGETSKTISVSPKEDEIYYISTGDSTCNVNDSVHVKVNYPPDVAITEGSDTTIISGSSIQLKGKPEENNQWHPSNGLSCSDCYDPIASPTATTTYHLTVTDKNGCIKKDSITIEVKECTSESIFIPSAFSPNSDGLNDLFYIKGGGVEIEAFHIFNRWGQLVFHGKNLNDSWDGKTNSEPANSGIYVYQVMGHCITSGERIRKVGHLALVR